MLVFTEYAIACSLTYSLGRSIACSLVVAQGVVFLVGLNGYNQRLFEDSSVNKMHESLKLFKQVPYAAAAVGFNDNLPTNI